MTVRSEVGPPRGLLDLKADDKNVHLTRLPPSSDLAFFIAHYWVVSWDIRRQPSYTSEVLPHPSVHLTVEKNRAQVRGVTTGKFTRRLQGQGRVFGIKFRPGTFYPVLGAPVSQITNQVRSLRTVFGTASVQFKKAVLGEADERQCTAYAEGFLRPILPKPSPAISEIRDCVEKIITDRELIRVEQVAALMGVNIRALQRMFHRYVGVSHKWVIQRYRLHEAIERLQKGNEPNMADLAFSLGYTDQAHFIRDFKAIVGKSPGAYFVHRRSKSIVNPSKPTN